LVAELTQEREVVRDLSTRLATATQESKTWQQKAHDANSEIALLRSTNQRKSKKAALRIAAL
jgi:hypothetical protein